LLDVLNSAIRVLVDAHLSVRRELIRQEESARQRFIEDLLRGDADVSGLVERAVPFGRDQAALVDLATV
jgi:hypothetical protein